MGVSGFKGEGLGIRGLGVWLRVWELRVWEFTGLGVQGFRV